MNERQTGAGGLLVLLDRPEVIGEGRSVHTQPEGRRGARVSQLEALQREIFARRFRPRGGNQSATAEREHGAHQHDSKRQVH